MTHELKCWPDFFEALWDGRKTFEARRNDRNFKTGDFLLLREWKPAGTIHGALGEYSGRNLKFRVTYVLHDIELNKKCGIGEGYVVMGIKKMTIAPFKLKK